jgi:hypothetical protein
MKKTFEHSDNPGFLLTIVVRLVMLLVGFSCCEELDAHWSISSPDVRKMRKAGNAKESV